MLTLILLGLPLFAACYAIWVSKGQAKTGPVLLFVGASFLYCIVFVIGLGLLLGGGFCTIVLLKGGLDNSWGGLLALAIPAAIAGFFLTRFGGKRVWKFFKDFARQYRPPNNPGQS